MKELVLILLMCSVRFSALVLFFSFLFKLFGANITSGVRYTVWRILAVFAIIPMKAASPLINFNCSQPIVNASGPAEPTTAGAIHENIFDIWQVLLFFWLAGAAVFLAYHVIRNLALISLIRRWLCSDKAAERIFAQVKSKGHIRGDVRFYRSRSAVTPIAFGLLAPTVVIPSGAYTDDELKLIFRHELTHIVRKDSFFKGIALLAGTVHWFNPLVYWFLHRFNAECELSCDEKMIAHCGREEQWTYGRLILKSAAKVNPYFGLYTSMAVKNSLLTTRLERIVSGDSAKRNSMLNAAALALSMAAAMVMPWAVGYAAVPMAEAAQSPSVPNHAETQVSWSTIGSDEESFAETTTTTVRATDTTGLFTTETRGQGTLNSTTVVTSRAVSQTKNTTTAVTAANTTAVVTSMAARSSVDTTAPPKRAETTTVTATTMTWDFS